MEYTPTPENLKARKAFQDAKFGMFIHWGVYSILGDAEWVMQNQDIPVKQYEKLPGFFNPIGFDAAEWVALAKAAGMKYITITSKHHDGFAMYDSKVSDYNIVKKTPFKRDIIRELEQECKKQGIKFFLYYSQLDWHHTDYWPRGWTGRRTGRPEAGNWQNYLAFQDAQIRELAENYDIAGFWFDGWWDQASHKASWHRAAKYRLPKDQIDWKLDRTYKMIHDINSALLIGNNHHEAPFPGEDFQMFEKDLPGKNTTGFGTAAEDIGSIPLETCETINRSWGFNLRDHSHKSLKTLVHYLIRAAGYGSNFLLNVGPMPDGRIQDEHQQLLRGIGEWTAKYGETIYGTSAGPVSPQDWGVTTANGKTIYLHILDPNLSELFVSDANFDAKSMQFFESGERVEFRKLGSGYWLRLPESERHDLDTIVKIDLK